MAHIEKRGPRRWRARYFAPDGRERNKTFDTRRDAERFLDSVRGDLVRGAYVDPDAGRRVFRDFLVDWQDSRVHADSTRDQVRMHMDNHVLPTFGDRQLGQVTQTQVQAWVRRLSDALAPSTVEVVFRHTASVFRAAVADGLIARSPCDRVKLPRRERRQIVPLETETVLLLADAAPARYRAAFVLAAGTGLRQGELFGLTLKHVDFPRRRLHIEQQLVTLNGRAPFFGPPKTAASHRTVPLPDVVLHEVVAHVAAFPDQDHNRRLVFTNRYGTPVRRSTASEIWHRTSARIERSTPGREGWHALRHYYASLLIRHGESVKVVQSRLGHASAAETLDTYSHLWPDSDDQTREAVDEVLGAHPASPLASSNGMRNRETPG